jgi:hypothetical protein
MHEPASVRRYTCADLIDMLGPAETQYCEATIQPSRVFEGQSATLVVDFSGMPNFDTVLYEVEGDLMPTATATLDNGNGIPQGGSIPRSAGEEKGSLWSVSEFVPEGADYGTWQIEVRLAEGKMVGDPCFASITILPD